MGRERQRGKRTEQAGERKREKGREEVSERTGSMD